jgi:hypothetical protein
MPEVLAGAVRPWYRPGRPNRQGDRSTMQTTARRRKTAQRLLGLALVLGLLPSTGTVIAAASVAPGKVVTGQSSASADIVMPGQSIDGIKLGESGTQVEQVLGTPTAGQISGGYLQYYPPSKFDGEIYFNAQGNVDGLSTGSSHFKTNKGIHVGSSFSAVHKAYPRAKYEPTISKPRYLTPRYILTSHYAGQTVLTVFWTSPVGTPKVLGIEIDFKSAVG